MKKFVALLLAVLMVASLCACGQKDTGSDLQTVTKGKLIMSTNAEFAPYEYVADDGKGFQGTGYEGIDIEIAYALAQKLGLELVVDDMDFDAALSAVQTGQERHGRRRRDRHARPSATPWASPTATPTACRSSS